jgi:circadian clock protein KaiC
MAHSNQIREFKLTDRGIELLDVYIGSEGVLTGSARLSQEMKDEAEQATLQQEIARKRIGLERKREAMEAQIVLLRSEFEAEEMEARRVIGIDKERNERFRRGKTRMAKSRKSDVATNKKVTKRTRTKT